eukprot:766746-Hanusia_phi.AAC.2
MTVIVTFPMFCNDHHCMTLSNGQKASVTFITGYSESWGPSIIAPSRAPGPHVAVNRRGGIMH